MQLCRESLTRRSDCFTDQEVPASELRSHQSGRKGENWTKRSAACRNRIDDFKVSQKLNSNSIEFQAIRKWAVGGYLEAAITRMERGSLRCSLVFLHIRNWKRIGCLPASSEPTSALCTDSAVGKRRKKKRIHAPQLANFDVDALDAKEGGLHVESPEFWRGKLEGSLDITLSLYFFSPFASLSSTPSGRNPISNQASHWARKVERKSLDLLLLRGGCLRAAPHRCRVRWREHRTSKDTRRGLHFDIIRPAVKIVAALTKTFAAASDEIGLLA